jgi:hypothetical protein
MNWKDRKILKKTKCPGVLGVRDPHFYYTKKGGTRLCDDCNDVYMGMVDDEFREIITGKPPMCAWSMRYQRN